MMEAPSEKDMANNNMIMSKTKPMGQFSFVDSRQPYNKVAPPPKYFTDLILTSTFGNLPSDKKSILKGMEFP